MNSYDPRHKPPMHLLEVGRNTQLRYCGIAHSSEVHSSYFHGQNGKPFISYVSKANNLTAGSSFFKDLHLVLCETFWVSLDFF